jgi:hypothetical protein
MKIEIDTENMASLERLEAELESALAGVRAVIQRVKRNGIGIQAGSGPADAARPTAPRPRAIRQAVAPQAVRDAISALPERFSSRGLREGAERIRPHIGRAIISRVIEQEVQAGRLELVQRAQGRRPAQYRKVQAAR